MTGFDRIEELFGELLDALVGERRIDATVSSLGASLADAMSLDMSLELAPRSS